MWRIIIVCLALNFCWAEEIEDLLQGFNQKPYTAYEADLISNISGGLLNQVKTQEAHIYWETQRSRTDTKGEYTQTSLALGTSSYVIDYTGATQELETDKLKTSFQSIDSLTEACTFNSISRSGTTITLTGKLKPSAGFPKKFQTIIITLDNTSKTCTSLKILSAKNKEILSIHNRYVLIDNVYFPAEATVLIQLPNSTPLKSTTTYSNIKINPEFPAKTFDLKAISAERRK